MFESIEEKQSYEKEVMMVTLLNNLGDYLFKHGQLINRQRIDDDYVTIHCHTIRLRDHEYDVITDELDGYVFEISKHN